MANVGKSKLGASPASRRSGDPDVSGQAGPTGVRQPTTSCSSVSEREQAAINALDLLGPEALWQLAQALITRGIIDLQRRDSAAAGPPPPQPAASAARSALAAAGTSPAAGGPAAEGAPAAEPAALPATQAEGAGAREEAPAATAAEACVGQPLAPIAEEAGRRAAPAAPAEHVEAEAISCLIVRNLPSSFSQQNALHWLDESGYKDDYDFVTLFPGRKTSRLSGLPYAFVNFRTPAIAVRFRSEFNGLRIADADGSGGVPLNIAIAHRQGFVENYVQFAHLTDNPEGTQCLPFFAEDALQKLSETDRRNAKMSGEKLARISGVDLSASSASEVPWPSTTLIVRNLPSECSTQERTRQWFDAIGFQNRYDFFLFFPGKARPTTGAPEEPSSQTQMQAGLGYFFVNFVSPEDAQRCVKIIHKKVTEDGTLNVVAAKKQGLQDLKDHFNTLRATGSRIIPWCADESASSEADVSQRQALDVQGARSYQ